MIACIFVRCILDRLNFFLVVRCILHWSNRFSCLMYLLEVPAVTSAAWMLVLDHVEGTLKIYCLESLLLLSFLLVRFQKRLSKTSELLTSLTLQYIKYELIRLYIHPNAYIQPCVYTLSHWLYVRPNVYIHPNAYTLPHISYIYYLTRTVLVISQCTSDLTLTYRLPIFRVTWRHMDPIPYIFLYTAFTAYYRYNSLRVHRGK